MQCHIVHWLGEGKGLVFKAGPGPLAEVGKLGVKGKTPCTECPCKRPAAVRTVFIALPWRLKRSHRMIASSPRYTPWKPWRRYSGRSSSRTARNATCQARARQKSRNSATASSSDSGAPIGSPEASAYPLTNV